MIYYTTSIKHIDFNLSTVTLDQISNLEVDHAKVCYEPLNDCATICLDNFSRFKISFDNKKQESYTLLLSKPKLLYYILVIVYLMRNTMELFSFRALGMVQQIIVGYDETFSKIILDYMCKVKESFHKTPLPYVHMLTKVFEYFKVPLKDKEYIEVVGSMNNNKNLEALMQVHFF